MVGCNKERKNEKSEEKLDEAKMKLTIDRTPKRREMERRIKNKKKTIICVLCANHLLYRDGIDHYTNSVVDGIFCWLVERGSGLQLTVFKQRKYLFRPRASSKELFVRTKMTLSLVRIRFAETISGQIESIIL